MIQISLILTLFLASTLTACGNSEVNIVKSGTMKSYDTTTVGKAFKASFDNENWKNVTSARGENVVKFNGTISKILHDQAVKEITDSLRGKSRKAKLTRYALLELAVAKVKQSGSTYILDINRAYQCSPEMNWAGFMMPNCDDKKNNAKYVQDALKHLANISWPVGAPVSVQWIVHPDGETFELKSMNSDAWEGIKYKDILDAIYGK